MNQGNSVRPTSITGAIFDCDGTLVDSMPMWNALVEETFDAYAIPKTPELLAEAEAYNFDDMCFWFHDRFGIGESGEAVLAEIRADVQRHYRTDIEPFAGCAAFLQTLHDAGVRMVILSATTEPEVRVALQTHGIEHFFERIIQTSETGTDKEHAGAYEYALAALGTPKESTWVFEDAPFGVRTAHDAGFKTVCLFNDHDGRDLSYCTQHSDILAHGYGELSLALLEDYARPEGVSDGVLRALLVNGSPQPSSPALVKQLADASDYVIAVDRGAKACQLAGVTPQMLCGDADSLDADTLEWAERASAAEIRYPQEKYATDLALAVACARHEAARRGADLRLTLTCASGGRPDHALAVLGELVTCIDAHPRIVEDGMTCQLLGPEGKHAWEVGREPEAVGATFSAIPLVADAEVSETGMHWPLERRALPLLGGEGESVSNVIESEAACVWCHSGLVAAYLFCS